MNSLHRLLNCEINGLDWHVITAENGTRVHCIHMYHLFCNAFVHVIFSGVSDQCLYTIYTMFVIRFFSYCARKHEIINQLLVLKVNVDFQSMYDY